MKKKTMFVMMAIAGVIAIASCGKSAQKSETPVVKQVEAKVVYVCPMTEDSISQDQPGKCPKCGMDLVKKEK